MMKFFRKYNKHLLAIFMALLLVIWLGGTALEQMMRPDTGKTVIGTALTGDITEADRRLAQSQSDLQELLNLSWRRWGDPTAPPDEQLSLIDWILLQREAEKFGIKVEPDRARSMLSEYGVNEATIRQILARRRLDVAVDRIYEAAAAYFTVQEMLTMFQSALVIPEPQLRYLARDLRERAAVELVRFPASAFADPDETFTEAALQAHFDKYKEETSVEGGLSFGYMIDRCVDIEYIRIDPAKIAAHLRGSDEAYKKRAYTYWKDNRQTDSRFRRPPQEMLAARKTQQDANTNGEPLPPISPFYETFADASTNAIEAVRAADAKAEADRIANSLIQALREPWFDIFVRPNEFKPAPDKVKGSDYYSEVVARLPAGLKYPDGVEVGSVKEATAAQLSELEGFAAASIELTGGMSQSVAEAAFNVEGFVTIPEDSRMDRSMFLSLWQTLTKPLTTPDGVRYLFRVVGTHERRAPASLDEVINLVIDDVRLMQGMERAGEAAESFAAGVGTSGLKAALKASTELDEKLTPDDAGYLQTPPFPRDSSSMFGINNVIPLLGVVTDEFMEKSFELAANADKKEVAVIELPDQAMVVAVKGVRLSPLYEKEYKSQRQFLQQQLASMKVREILFQWLNAKNVRERNQYKLGSRSG